MSNRSVQFAEHVLGSQRRLYAYILTLVPDPDSACDVLQQTNMVLWRDAKRFSEGTNFLSWAFRVAYFQVLDYREKRQRDRLRFDKELLDELAAGAQSGASEIDLRVEALRKCLSELPQGQRALVNRRYGEGLTVAAMAQEEGQTAGALAVCLHRIRRALLDCIQRRLAMEAGQ